VFEDAIRNHEIEWLNGDIKREVSFKSSRFDFLVSSENKTFIEVKCATFERNGIVMFPDAPTERGRRHISELIEAKREGYSAAIVIVSFMDYVTEFTPYYAIDREFGTILKKAVEEEVVFKVYNCVINRDYIKIANEININF
jgi:sugar fermentation stimulation protein A